jgi:hypothetical protein
MIPRTLSHRAPWMHTDEWAYALRLRRALLAPLQAAQVPLTSYIILRIHDYLVAMLLTRRAERVLVECPTDDGAPLPAPPAAQLEALAKQRERARKLLYEIEACLPKPGADSAKPVGLADQVKPLMQQFKHLEKLHFPDDLAFRLSTPDTPGAPLRFPPEPDAAAPAEGYAVEESPVEEGGDEDEPAQAGTPPAQRRTVPPPSFKHYIPSYLRDAPQEETNHTDTPPAPAPPQPPKPPPPSSRDKLPRYVAIIT